MERAPPTPASATGPPPDSAVPFGATTVGANAVTNPNAPVVGMAATPDGGGYWLVARDGGVFGYGDARFFGSAGALPLNAPVVGMAATPDGGGYWLVARDGGVFGYGDAAFFGSAGSLALNAPVVGMAATRDGRGYWLVAADGGIFSYGDARFWGSTGSLALNAPVAAWPPPPTAVATGWWGRDGGVFTYGDAVFSGSAGSVPLDAPIVGLAAAPGGGYWLVARDGGLFSYGGAPYFGSLGGTTLPGPVVGMAAVPAGTATGSRSGPNRWRARWSGSIPVTTGWTRARRRSSTSPSSTAPGYEPCDTTGTATDGGYTEAQFNFNVATDLAADLEDEGAVVVLTRPDNNGVGPCVTTRAAIINAAHADVSVDIHADGGPADGRGFTVLEPVADGPNDAVIAPSSAFASVLRDTFAAATPMPVSDYGGIGGLQPRNDLAGLNLTTVPKVLIECGNMRNATDADLLVTPAFQQSAAAAIAQAITVFLTGQSS